nr:hypothetical protein CFP56_33820 [Quercus suber]
MSLVVEAEKTMKGNGGDLSPSVKQGPFPLRSAVAIEIDLTVEFGLAVEFSLAIAVEIGRRREVQPH